VPPGVAGGVNAGDSRDSGRAGVCSPVVLLAWLTLSDNPPGSDCGGSFGEACAGRSAIAAERRGSWDVSDLRVSARALICKYAGSAN
jgi:hypothetical protein